MLKNISSIGVILNKTEQKSIQGGLTAYLYSCGYGTDGLDCLTGLSHCPTGRCGGSVCIPNTEG